MINLTLERKSTTLLSENSGKRKGFTSTESNSFYKIPVSIGSRFQGDFGTNPEELIASAHSACYSITLSQLLQTSGFESTDIKTECTITYKNGQIIKSLLEVDAFVPNISEDEFNKTIEKASQNCALSKLLNTQIVVKYHLENKRREPVGITLLGSDLSFKANAKM